MKMNGKRAAAIAALVGIAILLIAFVAAALTTTAESGRLFYVLFGCVIALPILAWLLLFCYGRFRNQHTMAELFPESMLRSPEQSSAPAESQGLTDEEITEAMENAGNQPK